ncbi:MAG TPA: sensor histidine kinase [Polyangia bacterium]|jgi:signal transduction histidine kinase
MPAKLLDRHFARRMLPVAVVAGLVVAVVPPLAYRVVAWQKLRGQAAVYARHVAQELRVVAERQPYLWRYNAGKILQATAIHHGRRDVGAVQVTDCAGRALLPAAARPARGPAGRAPVVSRGRTVAFVDIHMAEGDERARLLGIAGAAAATGALLGLVIFLLPTRVVRRQARALGDIVDRLTAAEAALIATNAGLAARVAAGVREVRALSARVVGTQEEERRRIARDLHDSVGQSVTALRLELELARSPGETAARLDQAARQCEATLADLRRVVHDLRPPELASGALEDILRGYTERFEQRTGIAVSFRCPPGIAVGEPIATCLLRVLQEALTNVSRHARAHEVGVTLRLEDGSVVMEVADDGVGADLAAGHGGSGLAGIRERCALLGGAAVIDVRPGAGARVAVRLPRGEAPGTMEGS